MKLLLYYDCVKIGELRDVFYSDETWHAHIELSINPNAAELEQRLVKFIEFCKDWIERVDDLVNPSDADEFEQFSDLLKSELWFVQSKEKGRTYIKQAPVFFDTNEVSWIEKD